MKTFKKTEMDFNCGFENLFICNVRYNGDVRVLLDTIKAVIVSFNLQVLVISLLTGMTQTL